MSASAEVKSVSGSVVTWDDSIALSSNSTAGVHQIYSTRGVSVSAEVKNVGGSVVTWDDSITYNSKSLAAGVQQIYSTRVIALVQPGRK